MTTTQLNSYLEDRFEFSQNISNGKYKNSDLIEEDLTLAKSQTTDVKPNRGVDKALNNFQADMEDSRDKLNKPILEDIESAETTADLENINVSGFESSTIQAKTQRARSLSFQEVQITERRERLQSIESESDLRASGLTPRAGLPSFRNTFSGVDPDIIESEFSRLENEGIVGEQAVEEETPSEEEEEI